MAAATALGNEVRAGKNGMVGSVLAAPFETPPTPDYDTGIEIEDPPDLPAGWLSKPRPASEIEWPPEPPRKPLPPMVWPTDADHKNPSTSTNAPRPRKGKTMTTTTNTGASARDYATYLDQSTPGTQAEKLTNAANAASRDAANQALEAEGFLAKARRVDNIPAMSAQAEEFRSEARKLYDQAGTRRDLATEFRNAADTKAAS